MTNQIKDNKEFMLNLYNLLIDLNLNKPSSEIIEDLRIEADPEIEQALNFIKQIKLKTKAAEQKSRFHSALEAIEDFRKKAGSTWNVLLGNQPGNEQLVGFFRKYDQVGEKDKLSMLQDKHILDLIKKAKEDIDKAKSLDGK